MSALSNQDCDVLLAAEAAPHGWLPWRGTFGRAKRLAQRGLLKECGTASMWPHVLYAVTKTGRDAALKHCAENF